MELFVPRYYTLDRIPEGALARIRNSLQYVRMVCDVTDYPLDCFQLLETIREAGIIHLDVKTEGRLSDGFEASATYFPEVDSYLIVMKPVPWDWQSRSSWRRCNFTLAHELAHIFCGHLAIPEDFKTKEERDLEDMEADEFAGRLLMPEEMILKSQFRSRSELAREFLVSEAAVFIRLNNLKRLDLFQTPRQDICPVCGNDRISPVADYCGICGARLSRTGKEGVRVVEYTRAVTDKNNRMLFCPVCGNEEFSDGAQYCRICGTPAYNWCASDDDFLRCRHVNDSNARYCELCGSPTVYLRKRLLSPNWLEERNAYIRAITQR